MYHVHTSTLSSSTTTTEPVSALSPSVLFPFFQPSSATGPPPHSHPTPSSATPTPTPPPPSPYTTTTSSSSSCPCHAPQLMPASAASPPTFITLPSANPHQSVILPLPQPSPPPASTAAAAASQPPTSSFPSSATPDATSTEPTTDSASQSNKSPLLVFSHGSTQVDTFVPSSQCLQRTLYSWSQLSDYTTKYCWDLPSASSSTTQSSQAAGQPVGHNVSINNSNGRICQGDDVTRCPGHPWVNFSYHMQVKQWQERREDAMAAAAAAASTQPQQPITTTHTTPATHHMSEMGVKGLEVRVAPATDILVDGLRRHRHHPAARYADADSDGSMFDDVDEGDDADDDDDSWNDLCSTTDDDDENDYELTDVDM